MNDSGGQKENLQPTKEQRIQSMLDLSKKHGTASKIPEEELSAIGYVRMGMDDGTVRLIPNERLQELKQKDANWEKSIKEKERPFGRITLELSTSEHSYRFIPRDQRRVLRKKLYEIECAFYPNWDDGRSIMGELEKTDQRLQNLRIFSLDFLDYLKRGEVLSGRKIPEDAAKIFLFGAMPARNNDGFDPDDPNDFLQEDFQKTHSELDGSVTSIASKQMYDKLTRLGGYFTDESELTKDFQNKLAEPFSLVDEMDEKLEASLGKELSVQGKLRDIEVEDFNRIQATREIEEYLRSIGILTRADLVRYAFPKYLEHVGLSEMGAVISKSVSLYTLADTLRYMNASDSYRAEEQELRRALKTATPEERNVLSKQIKDIEDTKKRRKQIRQGVIDYFSSPQAYADVAKRKVKEAQDFLIAGKGEQKTNVVFYLDANENKELDRDPGKISGDCTAGKPLPFNRPDLPLYNVKVFNANEQHLGNMYLLVTNLVQNETEKKKVWHFDAIQVPGGEINWRKSAGQLLSLLAEKAELKKVDVITANSEIHQISNYDYIAYAVRDYWDKNGRQIVDINIPKISDSQHSELQGTGNAIVLWSKDILSEAFEGELEVNEGLFNQQNEQD